MCTLIVQSLLKDEKLFRQSKQEEQRKPWALLFSRVTSHLSFLLLLQTSLSIASGEWMEIYVHDKMLSNR